MSETRADLVNGPNGHQLLWRAAQELEDASDDATPRWKGSDGEQRGCHQDLQSAQPKRVLGQGLGYEVQEDVNARDANARSTRKGMSSGFWDEIIMA